MLTAEVPGAALDRDAVGRTLARLVAVCDLLLDESSRLPGPADAPATAAGAPDRPAAERPA